MQDPPSSQTPAVPPPTPAAIRPEDFAARNFDILIIGGGTAGLVVAARLSEDPGLTVGVLEAGSLALGDEAIDVPGLYGATLGRDDRDWRFETAPQSGLGGRTLAWPRGRVVGGTSALNFMTWNRASREDYDAWRELGNEGWGWDDLLPFFMKSETFHPPTTEGQKAAVCGPHADVMGTDGPVHVSYPFEYSASHNLWHRTLNELGIPSNDAHMAGSNVGAWTTICSVDSCTGARSYATPAYYLPNAHRPNLVLLTGAEVREITLKKTEDGEGWVAEGVVFTHGGIDYSVSAAREVILSAGSVKSPHILELSGIGGREVLSTAGIQVKVDNPNVGEHLQDHFSTFTIFEVDPALPNPDDAKTDTSLAEAARTEYLQSRSGPLTILPCSLCYVPVSKFMSEEELEAALSTCPPAGPIDDDAFAERDAILRRRFTVPAKRLGHVEYIFDLGNWSPFFQPDPSDGKKYGTMLQILQYPFAKGSIHVKPAAAEAGNAKAAALEGNEPTSQLGIPAVAKPIIDPQYYAGRQGHFDLEIMVQGHRLVDKICATEPLAGIIRGRVFPPPELDAAGDDDDGLRAWIRRSMVTDWHPVGTCSMGGRQGARAGVVDARLRVYGVRRLRVVDASIMPLQISGHLQATVYCIAEKAAQMIKEDLTR